LQHYSKGSFRLYRQTPFNLLLAVLNNLQHLRTYRRSKINMLT
jgi:hypothetical protein